MDTQQPPPSQSPHPPHLITDPNNPAFPSVPSRTASSTPISSPGLFSPTIPRPNVFLAHSASDASTPAVTMASPYLHPLQNHRVRETHKALVDLDLMTGRKIINQYEVIEELGRGVHGKVKLARNLETGENVAIKIIPRFSKKRRLGKVTASPQDKTKREIAILKKIRHPNVVALLEIIDDPEFKKIYMVLEHVELGEVIWRKKGLPYICSIERRRIEKEMRGELSTDEEERYIQLLERRQALNDVKRAKMQQSQKGPDDFWSIEYGAANDDDSEGHSRSLGRNGSGFLQSGRAVSSVSRTGSRATSPARSHAQSAPSGSRASTPLPSEYDVSSVGADAESVIETPGPLRSQPGSSSALDRTLTSAYPEDAMFRGRSPSMADSIISHMSSVDCNPQPHDPFADDFSYVPCFTIDDARATFRDTVLGLEYLHYEGVVHRDIKPANLLWTRDHRVKISDFGVSYFGRPIREGEQDELVSESEARDFDDDLELAKTVGTPAFFAPELCYTDLSVEQPKISEQIDVWSLGVTLYCLIFARIPFMAEDEWQMFQKIAKEEVYIPRRRLRPVDPQHSPQSTSLYKRINSEPYRDDSVLAYEEIDDLLYDLLRRMLTKNPEKRIRLREVKRHPWVLQGIPNIIAWIDETDPSRRTSGRKIEVDEREITRAVVPLTFLERARSVVKKTIGKVMHPRTERAEVPSRRRAASSAASSAGDTPPSIPPPHVRDTRRKSLRPDDYFATVRESDHPLSQSVTASPQESPVYDRPDSAQQRGSTLVGGDFRRNASSSVGDFNTQSDLAGPPSASASLSSIRGHLSYRHGRTRSITNAILALAPQKEWQTTPNTPALETCIRDDPIASLRKARDVESTDDSSRSRSVDRGLFGNSDKRAEAKVALSTAVAPGNVELPKRPLSVHPPDTTSHTLQDAAAALPSPMFFSPRAVRTYQHRQPSSDPNMHETHMGAVEIDQRPMTAHRAIQIETRTPPPRVYNSSTPESFARAHEQMARRRQREDEEQAKREKLLASHRRGSSSTYMSCPPSPDDELSLDHPPSLSRGDPGTAATSASASTGTIMTPLTSPSESASPISLGDMTEHGEDSQIFRSDPSLPALLSGASSISADAEGEFLLKPGSLDRPSLIDTTDSLTPPALHKEPISGFPLEEDEHYQTLLLPQPQRALATSSFLTTRAIDDDDGSDSDEGLVMKPKKRNPVKDNASSPLGRTMSARRRDTQTSIGSTETAKKVVMQSQ
ncbi:kinase-like protein [Annulohypoxylon truncatum]|uniref:kinase-like protein n=1 Tax=Annulohypoxylon truncatum TaxID=327061 RepID=UPI002007C35E|nr:kinase-like protein [Annulohypoxylon truncatum]KAI1206130.1 kinase-like protein [Annulohypoxylon truncatum]